MFFPQPQTLETLATQLAPTLTRASGASPLRVWVPWCSRGEEVWSLAVCLWECFEAIHAEPHIRLFATDRDENAVAVFRRGLYPPDIVRQVSARRLARFFERHTDGYRVGAALRRTVLVGQHDALGDPPIFTGLDLIDCRGLPEHIEATRVIALFQRLHFALKDGGWLLLGEAVPTRALGSLFEAASIDSPIYRKRSTPQSFDFEGARDEGSIESRPRRARLEERLRNANRRIAAMAAEIDMVNEELRDSNIRIRSLNEELAVLTSTLEQRARELDDANDDLANLIAATNIVVAFLDRDLRVRRFTSGAGGLVPPGLNGIGRRSGGISPRFVDAALERAVRRVIDTARPAETELPAGEDRWYLRRIRPIGAGGHVLGALVVWIDITPIRLLQGEISGIASAEQQRIGQELHDGIQQELTGLGLLAEALSDTLAGGGAAANTDLAGRLAQGISAANERLHTLARGLVPVPIDADSLVPALSELARSTREAFRVICLFEPAQVRVRDAETATHLYRIAQEAVRNATRHSNADRVEIRLVAPDGELMLEVTDNGVGLPPPGRLQQGVGLRLMEHRCSLLGGRFIAESRARRGTRIACILPARTDRSSP